MENKKHIKTKNMGDYEINYFQENPKNKDYLILTITINQEIQEVLKQTTIEEKTDFNTPENKIKRFLVKSPINNAIYSNYKYYIFSCDLVNKKKLKLKINSTKISKEIREGIIYSFRELFKEFLEVDIKQTIIFKPQ